MERKMKRKEESGRIEESGSGSSEGEKPRKKWGRKKSGRGS